MRAPASAVCSAVRHERQCTLCLLRVGSRLARTAPTTCLPRFLKETRTLPRVFSPKILLQLLATRTCVRIYYRSHGPWCGIDRGKCSPAHQDPSFLTRTGCCTERIRSVAGGSDAVQSCTSNTPAVTILHAQQRLGSVRKETSLAQPKSTWACWARLQLLAQTSFSAVAQLMNENMVQP